MSLSSSQITNALMESGKAYAFECYSKPKPSRKEGRSFARIFNRHHCVNLNRDRLLVGYFDNPFNNAPLFLIVKLYQGAGLRNILICGPRGVIHGQLAEWHAGLEAFRTLKRDDMILGSSTADNKG